MRFLVMSIALVVGMGCTSQAERDDLYNKQMAAWEAVEQAKRDRIAWLQANKHYNEDQPPFVVLEVRASHLLSPVETTIEKSGAPAAGAAAGGGTAALLGFGPVGVVVAGAMGAAALSGGSSVQQVATDSTTCIMVAEQKDTPGKIETLTFQTSQNKDWTGICLAARPGDTVFFRKKIERVWTVYKGKPYEDPDRVQWQFLLEAKPPK